MSIEQQIIAAIDALFSNDKIVEQDKAHVALIYEEAQRLSGQQKQQLSEYLLNSALPPDNELPLLFFLYDCFQDIRFLEATLPLVPASPSVPWFYEFYWNMAQRLFTRSDDSSKIQSVMRERFYRIAAKTRKFLTARRLVSKQLSLTAPKTIAILVPQLRNMRHSPTREAFNIALHLQHYHDCHVHIINTNGMSYKNCLQLGLLMPATFHTNESLSGQQQVPVNYMHFDSKVNTVSFEAGPMTSQKIAQIANVLKQLEVEAVIAHGDNLLVMESLYGFYPSLFATTGGVVPYNHCDAYFIPGRLFTDQAKALAASYNHSNFMLESMLVTPEGKASQPAARASFQLDEHDFLYLVVGTRLTGELDHDFGVACETLLQHNPQAKIIFAGTPELDLTKYFDPALVSTARILSIGFQDDLPAVSAMCDVYLNPKRSGGGTSSQTAILNGLPVVTLDFGHISAIVPADKRMANWQDYIAYANKLCQDSAFLTGESDRFTQHFIQNLDSASQVARMYDKLTEVAAAFE